MNTILVPGVRAVLTRYGDTLQRLAQRELGAAEEWVTIATLNRLVPPYITDDPDSVADGVVLSGSAIFVPSQIVEATRDSTPEDLFGIDIRLVRGEFVVENGDMQPISGIDNLNQALRHLLVTEPGELLFHPRYGCGVRRFLGASNLQANAIVAGSLVKRAVLDDARIATVRSATVDVSGDALRIEVTAVAIHDVPVTVEVG